MVSSQWSVVRRTGDRGEMREGTMHNGLNTSQTNNNLDICAEYSEFRIPNSEFADVVRIEVPFSDDVIEDLRAGDHLLLSGVIYTGRDAAHKRMIALLDENKPLPFDVHGQAIYYTGPCPAPPGRVIGSAGPTTSGRMDAYAPHLIEQGLRVMIGKGSRNETVVDAIIKHKGLYLSAIGGAGALMALCIEQTEIIAFEDLGPEAIYKLVVREMPLVVAIDCRGGSIYGLGNRE